MQEAAVSLHSAWLIGCGLAAGEILTIVAMVGWWLCIRLIPGLAEKLELGCVAILLMIPIPATLIGGAAGLIWALLHPTPPPEAGNSFMAIAVLPAMGVACLIGQGPGDALKQAREDPLYALFLAIPTLKATGLVAAGLSLAAAR